jgi:DNA replication and repair protein RecF
MYLKRLHIHQLRNLVSCELSLDSGLNLFTGANGAGKTSVIEAVHILGYGRSFRGRVRDGLIQAKKDSLELFIQWQDSHRGEQQAGLRHSGSTWTARLNGNHAPSLTELCARVPVVCFEPGSHELISGGAEHRRRFVDWGLFHVEPEFVPLWRRYSRALKQRNALLKIHAPSSQLEAWEIEMAQSGEFITRQRHQYLQELEAGLAQTAQHYLPELGLANLAFLPGWKRQELSLQDALVLSRARDLQTGNTSVGPHRADWSVGYHALQHQQSLSRGQEKLTALACIMAQAQAYFEKQAQWPVICMDDLASELDQGHLRNVLTHLLASGAQVLLTATEVPAALEINNIKNWFHVEHGVISPKPMSA